MTEITLGNVLTIISIVVTVGLALAAGLHRLNEANEKAMSLINQYHQSNSQRLTALETKVDALWTLFTERMERRTYRRPEDG